MAGFEENFDDIRPFRDDEIPAAMQRVSQHPLFPQVARFVYPDIDPRDVAERIKNYKNTHELQSSYMNDAVKRMIDNFSEGFSYSGLNNLRRGRNYLFISNHRDITLDAFLLQHVLIEERNETSYCVFGENLLEAGGIEDMFRSNKLIRMSRGGSPRAFYNSLLHLSHYIKKLVVDEHQSVWIAQKNGRAKDGIDTTAPAVIKMLSLANTSEPIEYLSNLHIVPIAISYEWEPCDMLKTAEVYKRRRGEYTKAEGEDLTSIVTGIISPKGKIHLSFGRELVAADLAPQQGVDVAEHVASIIDERIHSLYKLHPTNYIAYDILNKNRRFAKRYTTAQHTTFVHRMEMLENDEQRDIYLHIYANPVKLNEQ